MFDCEITIPGDGVGKYGRFKENKTGPVRQFMVDNVTLYPKVKEHILGCDKCDCEWALKYYLNRRRTHEKFGGQTTETLVKLALSYERKSKNPISPKIVNEFIWRCSDINTVAQYQDRLNVRELVNSFVMLNNMMRKDNVSTHKTYSYFLKKWSNSSGRMGAISKVFSTNPVLIPEDDQELEKIIKVAEVMID